MPTLYEVFFWIAMLFVCALAFGFFAPKESLYVSQYELDRLNGNKY